MALRVWRSCSSAARFPIRLASSYRRLQARASARCTARPGACCSVRLCTSPPWSCGSPSRQGPRGWARLSRLVNDLLEVSRVEAGRLSVVATRFAMARVVQDAVTTIRPLADKAGLTLAVDVAPAVGTVCADERACYQVLATLLSNAVKF